MTRHVTIIMPIDPVEYGREDNGHTALDIAKEVLAGVADPPKANVVLVCGGARTEFVPG